MSSRRRRSTAESQLRKTVIGKKTLNNGCYLLHEAPDAFCDIIIYNDRLKSFPFDGTSGACTGFVRTLSKKFPRARIVLLSSNDALFESSRTPPPGSTEGDNSSRFEDLRRGCEVRFQKLIRLTDRYTWSIRPFGSSWKPKRYEPLIMFHR